MEVKRVIEEIIRREEEERRMKRFCDIMMWWNFEWLEVVLYLGRGSEE